MTDARTQAARRRSYPALRSFCRGYLHEDALAEYGSAAGAVAAFRADASAKEQRALEADWRRFAADTADWPLDRLSSHFAGALGAAWAPGSRDDLDSFAAALAPTAPSR
jgi:hypothetical protein